MIRLNLFMIWFLHFLSLLSVICRYYRQNSSSQIIVVLVYTVSTFFLNEQRRAKKLSEPPLTIIIGNPPCSDSVDINNEGKIIANLMNDFRPKVRKGRSNKQKQLANEMTKFLRWCLFKAETSRPSIFALVLPSTFAQNESFVTARKYLV